MTRTYSINESGSADGSLMVKRHVRKRDFSRILQKHTGHHKHAAEKKQESSFVGARMRGEANKVQELVTLGTISRRESTVSNLLIKHPLYGKNCWRIIHSKQNQNRQYTRIQVGTTIYLNPKTLEISWNQDIRRSGSRSSIVKDDPLAADEEFRPAGEADSFSEQLIKAVKPYVGRSYSEIDCYGLLIRGLRKLGIRYRGEGGLREQLVRMAEQRGRPSNAYLNGEGLIEASGSRIYSQKIATIRHADAQAQSAFQEMKPFLREGLILSFSTRTKGHTGIVSRKNRSWTFINSGRMDHSVESPGTPEGVGEELLSAEIKNWFSAAANRKETLYITLGELQEEKLAAFHNSPSIQSRNV